MALEIGMLPSEFIQRASSLDIGLITAYRTTRRFYQKEAEERAALMAGADANAQAAKDL